MKVKELVIFASLLLCGIQSTIYANDLFGVITSNPEDTTKTPDLSLKKLEAILDQQKKDLLADSQKMIEHHQKHNENNVVVLHHSPINNDNPGDYQTTPTQTVPTRFTKKNHKKCFALKNGTRIETRCYDDDEKSRKAAVAAKDYKKNYQKKAEERRKLIERIKDYYEEIQRVKEQKEHKKRQEERERERNRERTRYEGYRRYEVVK